MRTHNPQNERIKRAYFTYLAEAKGLSEATLDAVAKALNRFESYTRFRDFKAFHIEQAKGFKANLSEQMRLRTKDHLSKATLYATLSALKRFFIWLVGQPGYKSRISYSDAEYFNLSAKETRIAKAQGRACAHPGANPARNPNYADQYRPRTARSGPHCLHDPDRRPRRGYRVPQAPAHRY
jgi:hypothetical protein